MAQHDPDALARWRTVLATWRSSGLTITAYCRAHAITVSNFYRWRNILEQLDPSPLPSTDATAPPAFVPVRVIPDTLIEVILPSGVQLRVPLGADAQQIARLAQALGAPSC